MIKKFPVFLVLFALSVLIVLPVISTVNDLASNHSSMANVLSANGSPLPLPTPPSGSSTLTANGSPLPLPTPPSGSSTLTANGSPLPLPTPPSGSSAA